MDLIIAVSALLKITFVLFAFEFALRMSKRMDGRLGISWPTIVGMLHENALAAALYFGLRLVAIALVVGLAVS